MCMMETKLAQVENPTPFAERMIEVLNHGALTLMISIGHRTGLFDAMDRVGTATSTEIAAAAGLQERYVREWLGAMVTGGIVHCDETGAHYRLPQEHADFLTRQASPNNMGSVAQFIPLLAQVEDQIIACFRDGGGVPYSAFPRFHEVMMEESDQSVVAALQDAILPAAQGLVEQLEAGIRVMDVGCGRGRALMAMAAAFPQSEFTGIDFSEEAIAEATQEAEKRSLLNLRFRVQDAAQLDHVGEFELITAFDAIHDQVQPSEVLRCIQAALAPGGTFLMQDIGGTSHVHKDKSYPLAPLLYTISCMHCMTVSLSAGGAGLGAMWGREVAVDMLDRAGFRDVEVKKLDHDELNLYFIARK